MSFSPFQELVRVAEARRASAALFEWVGGLVSRASAGRGQAVDIPPSERDDVMGDVLLKLIENARPILTRIVEHNAPFGAAGLHDPAVVLGASPPDCLAAADRVLARYVRTMLGRRWLSLYRRRSREQVTGDGHMTDSMMRDAVDEAPKGQLEGALDVVRRALDYVVATRRVDEEQARETFSELVDLAVGARGMNEIVDALVAGDPDLTPDDARRARERLYRRHRLLRQYLGETLDSFASDHRFDPSECELARLALSQVLTRRRPIARR